MKARILVIEDEMSINDLLCMNLEIAGYETVGYLDGNEAYEAIIQDHAFQCALVDIMLPGRDGYSLLPKLKQYEIPVIFLTAKGDIASKIKGLKDGAEDYIVKPFEMLEELEEERLPYLSLRKITAPLTGLREATLLVSEGIYDFKVPSEGNTELAQIGATFNFMTGKIKEQIESLSNINRTQKQLIGSLAHENYMMKIMEA
jgi:CheY-like chemotaxis protein